MKKNDTVTIKEAQQLLAVNKKDLYKMIKSGKLTTCKVGTIMRINKKSLKAVLQCSSTLNEKINDNVSSYEINMIADWT